MSTTIQISDEMQEHLNSIKLFSRETYNDVLERIFEDMQELNEKTRKEIELAMNDIESGHYKTHEEVGKELGF
jgi:predicted transcriptional regulator